MTTPAGESTRLQACTLRLAELRQRLETCMHNTNSVSERFITKDRLLKVWANVKFRDLFSSFEWHDDESITIRKRHLKIFSILTLIGWPNIGTSEPTWFRERFLNESQDDTNLPFTVDKLPLPETHANNFLGWQYAFCPVVIEEQPGCSIQRIEAKRRLPFIGKQTVLGSGSFGKVTKVTVAPRYYRDVRNQRYSETSIFACKTHHTTETNESLAEELKILEYIKREVKADEHIVDHFASIAHGPSVMILLQYADLHDLDVFFRGGYKIHTTTSESDMIYNFDLTFPGLHDDTLCPALIRQAWGIASALQRLHDGIQTFGEPQNYVAHMDIKLDNILLVRDGASPIGRLLLSDFGIARFERVRGKTDPNPSRSLHSTSSTPIRRRRWCAVGTCRPLEKGDTGVDGRKYDVWLFGCVLVDILAFALGRGPGVKQLRALKYDGRDDFYYNSHTGKLGEKHGPEGELKTSVAGWLDDCANNAHPCWSNQYVRIIRGILVRDPGKRPSMKEIAKSLSELPRLTQHDAMTPPEHRTPSPGDDIQPIEQSISATIGERTVSDTAGTTRQCDQPVGTNTYVPPVLTDPYASREATDTILPQTSECDNIESADMTRTPSLSKVLGCSRQYGVLASELPLRQGTADSYQIGKDEKVTSFAATPSGEYLVLLLAKSFKVYSLGARNNPVSTRILESTVRWMRIAVGAHYVALYGIERCNDPQKLVRVFDFEEMSNPRSPGRTSGGLCKKACRDSRLLSGVIVSAQGFVACAYGSYVLLQHPTGSVARRLDLPRGPHMRCFAFSAGGPLLCAWAISPKEGSDGAFFWDVRQSSNVPTYSERFYKIDTSSTSASSLWPYPKSAACVIREEGGCLMLVAQHIEGVPQAPQARDNFRIADVLSACVTTNDTLLCVVRRRRMNRLVEYHLRTDARPYNRMPHAIRDLGSLGKACDRTTVAITTQDQDHIKVLYCCWTDRHVEATSYILTAQS